MKKLIKHTAIFFAIFCSIILVFLGIYTKQTRNQFSKYTKLTYLFLGDSHVQNGINPSHIANSANFASSAESYFIIYEKLKFILSHTRLEHIVIPVGVHNFRKEIDTNWILNKSNFISKISDVYPILNFSDLQSEINCLNFPLNIYLNILDNSVYQSIYGLEYSTLNRKPAFIGGYTPNVGQIDKEISNNNRDSFILTSKNTSSHQLRNFVKILAFCKSQNIKITLLAIPIYNSGKNNLDVFIGYLKKQGFTFDYFNHLNLITNKYLFKDPNHLNVDGSQFYSEYLNTVLTK
jgi:hypothetical protein